MCFDWSDMWQFLPLAESRLSEGLALWRSLMMSYISAKNDCSLMGWPCTRQPNGNAVISQKINAIIKYSDHTCRTKLQHRRLHF